MKDKKDKKRMNNKGFSFVELIIAIAILAIMAGVLAPQLIKYIDSSRKSTDVQNAQAIATAVNIALANEEAYKDAQTKANGVSGKRYPYALSQFNVGTPDEFQKKVYDILVNLTTPKYRGNGAYTDFVIVIDGTGSSLSFEIYPGQTDGSYNTTDTSKIQLYPTVGTNYTN
jgi:type IV pilus assembly protein PilA